MAQYGGEYLHKVLRERPESLNSVIPDLEFFIFAGRRRNIDASPAMHDVWSKFLKDNSDLVIKSYDYIVDAFLDGGDQSYRTPESGGLPAA